MKKLLSIFVYTVLLLTAKAQPGLVKFTSTDSALQTAFNRAKEMALSYNGKPGDPVGDWYESALPPRYAFCMRDVAHQSIAGEILGLSSANKNMFTLFASNISDSKDWCSYWEINKWGKPAPADYRNDTAFWYNLVANFDILNACWNLYLWTGDTTYINSPAFNNFFERSVNDFVQRWQLAPASLLTRTTYPNAGPNFNEQDDFNRCRGLPSYSEGVTGIKMGIDMVAALYRGMISYAAILKQRGQVKQAAMFVDRAKQYQQHIDEYWWDEKAQQYNTYYSKENEFGKTEGETFLLWFDALKIKERKEKTLHRLIAGEWNVENLSYFPFIMYQNGYADEGYKYILHLTDPGTKRREYPEVSFGVIKGITEGLMGLEPNAVDNSLLTVYRHTAPTESTLSDLPVLGTTITLTHRGKDFSRLTNNGRKKITWKPSFAGRYKQLYVNKKKLPAKQAILKDGKIVTYVELNIKPGATGTVSTNEQ